MREYLLLLLVPVAVVVLLGAYRIAARPLSLDETTSYYLTQIGWGRFVEVAADSKVNMSLYFSLLRLWPLTGDEAGLRALSVVFGVLTIPPLVALGRRIMPAPHAIAASVLLAMNELYLFELRDARGYSLTVFLVVLGTWALTVAVESRRASWWVGWGIVMALSLYAHFFAAFVLLAQLVALVWTRPSVNRGGAIVAGVILLAAAVPIGLTVLLAGGATLNWVQPTTWGRLFGAVSALAGSGAAIGVYALGLLVGAALLWRWRSGTTTNETLVWRLMWLSATLPLITIVLLSLLKPVLVDRYLLVALPFALVATIAALTAISIRVGTVAVAILLVISTVTTIAQLRTAHQRPPTWVAFMTRQAEPGDGVIFADAQWRKVLAYYLPEEVSGKLALATSDIPIDANPYEARPPSGASLEEALVTMPCRHQRVWYVGGPANLQRARDARVRRVAGALTDSYTEIDARRFGNRWVRLWERNADVDCA